MEEILEAIKNLRSCANCAIKEGVTGDENTLTIVLNSRCRGCKEYSQWNNDYLSSKERWESEL